jgi:hypothetical protein
MLINGTLIHSTNIPASMLWREELLALIDVDGE